MALHVEQTSLTKARGPTPGTAHSFPGSAPVPGHPPGHGSLPDSEWISRKGMLYALDTPSTPSAEAWEVLMGFRYSVSDTPPPLSSPSYNESNFMVSAPPALIS